MSSKVSTVEAKTDEPVAFTPRKGQAPSQQKKSGSWYSRE